MAVKNKTRKYWLGELQRARIGKKDFVENMMIEHFKHIDIRDAEAVVTAMDLCEKAYMHFLKSFEKWVDDNYPAPVREQNLF